MKHAFILLWPHGFQYNEQIFTKIAEKYKIIYHNSFKINNLENFVMNLYVNENPEHIKNKNKFLLTNNQNGQIYVYIFQNEENDIELYGNTLKSKGVEDLKIYLRNLYNPKLPNPNQRIMPLKKGVSHNHVIHSSDLSREVPEFCKMLNINYEIFINN